MADIYEFWVWPEGEYGDPGAHIVVLATSKKRVVASLSRKWGISKREVARTCTIENMGFFGREKRRR